MIPETAAPAVPPVAASQTELPAEGAGAYEYAEVPAETAEGAEQYEYVEVPAETAESAEQYEYVEVPAETAEGAEQYEYVEVPAETAEGAEQYEYVEVPAETAQGAEQYEYVEVPADSPEAVAVTQEIPQPQQADAYASAPESGVEKLDELPDSAPDFLSAVDAPSESVPEETYDFNSLDAEPAPAPVAAAPSIDAFAQEIASDSVPAVPAEEVPVPEEITPLSAEETSSLQQELETPAEVPVENDMTMLSADDETFTETELESVAPAATAQAEIDAFAAEAAETQAQELAAAPETAQETVAVETQEELDPPEISDTLTAPASDIDAAAAQETAEMQAQERLDQTVQNTETALTQEIPAETPVEQPVPVAEEIPAQEQTAETTAPVEASPAAEVAETAPAAETTVAAAEVAETAPVVEAVAAAEVAETAPAAETVAAAEVAETTPATEAVAAAEVAETAPAAETVAAAEVAETAPVAEAVVAAEVAETAARQEQPAADANTFFAFGDADGFKSFTATEPRPDVVLKTADLNKWLLVIGQTSVSPVEAQAGQPIELSEDMYCQGQIIGATGDVVAFANESAPQMPEFSTDAVQSATLFFSGVSVVPLKGQNGATLDLGGANGVLANSDGDVLYFAGLRALTVVENTPAAAEILTAPQQASEAASAPAAVTVPVSTAPAAAYAFAPMPTPETNAVVISRDSDFADIDGAAVSPHILVKVNDLLYGWNVDFPTVGRMSLADVKTYQAAHASLPETDGVLSYKDKKLSFKNIQSIKVFEVPAYCGYGVLPE